MNKLNKICAYVLTIDRNLEQESIRRRLGLEESVNLEVCLGITPDKLTSSSYFEAIKNLPNNRILTPAEVCCALGHKRILQDFLASKFDFALVFEDDVQKRDSVGPAAISGALLELVKLKAEFCFLGGQDGLASRGYLHGKRCTLEISNIAIYKLDKKLWHYSTRAACIFLGKSAAHVINRNQTMNIGLSDDWRRNLNGLHADKFFIDVYAHPQDLKNSNIEKERSSLILPTKKWGGVDKWIFKIKLYFFSMYLRAMGYEKIFKI